MVDVRHYTVTFRGMAGDDTDNQAQNLIKRYHGQILGGGTTLIEPMTRDLDVMIPRHHADNFRKAAKRIKLNVEINNR